MTRAKRYAQTHAYDTKLKQDVALGYSKTSKNTRTGLVIGVNYSNSMPDMANAHVYNTTKKSY